MKVVLPLKFMSLGCTMVTIRSETLLYMSTPQYYTPFFFFLKGNIPKKKGLRDDFLWDVGEGMKWLDHLQDFLAIKEEEDRRARL